MSRQLIQHLDFGEMKATNHFNGMPFTYLSGMRIFVEPPQPAKLSLSEHVQVSDEFRADFDAWLLVEFGRKDPLLKPGQVLQMAGFGMMVSQQTYDAIIKADSAI